MITELCDQDVFSNHFVNNSMLGVDPAGPISLQRVFERFRLSDAAMRRAHDFFDKQIDSRNHVRIGPLPVQIIFPRLRREDEIHASSLIFRLIPLPFLSVSIAPSRRRAFAGERKR